MSKPEGLGRRRKTVISPEALSTWHKPDFFVPGACSFWGQSHDAVEWVAQADVLLAELLSHGNRMTAGLGNVGGGQSMEVFAVSALVGHGFC